MHCASDVSNGRMVFSVPFKNSEYTKFGPSDSYGVGKDGYKVGYHDTNCVYAMNSKCRKQIK